MHPPRSSRIKPFLAMETLRAANERAATGAEVLHLELGEPGGGAPRTALRAAEEAMTRGNIGYTDAFGIPSLREGIARLYADWYGLDLPSSRIAVTSGASGGFVLAFLAAFDAGDRVAVADPGYPCYRNTLAALDMEVVRVETRLEHGFQPTIDDLEALDGPLHGLVIASPANPTGSMIDDIRLAEITRWCERRGVRLISDEIYHGITYDRPATTVLSHGSSAVVVNSFSKFFCMTGWRIGWLVLPEDLLLPVERLAQNLYISPSTIGQHAAAGALMARDELRGRIHGYRTNRDIVLQALAEAGIDELAPAQGAFYIYAHIGHLTRDSVSFCRKLLERTGVAVTPGVDFDPVSGNEYIRLSFAGDEASVRRAAELLAPALAQGKPL